jgi:hypothetical protein
MALVVKGLTSVFLKDEVTEGTYVAPAASADAMEVLEEFSGFEYSRESIERTVLSNTVESEAPRAGLPSVNGALPTELKAAATEGAAPRANVALKSLMGAKRNSTALEVGAGSTATVIELSDADGVKVQKGDVLMFKKAGEYAYRPIASVDTTPGSMSATLAFALPYTPATGVDIAAFTTYYHDTNDVTFSVTAEMGGDISERVAGCRVEAGEFGWNTGEIPSASFTIKGLSMVKETTLSGITADFSSEPQPPVALNAKAYINGVAVDYNSFSLNIANTINDVLSSARAQGKAASRLTKFLVTGSINPYMESDDTDRFDAFNEGDNNSLFLHIANPSSTDGEFANSVCIWMPKVNYTAVNTGDEDGVLTDEIEFQASKTAGNDTLFLTFI